MSNDYLIGDSRCLCFLFRAGSKVVFVPSQRDVHHHFVYPQPPFEIPDLQNENKSKEVTDWLVWRSRSANLYFESSVMLRASWQADGFNDSPKLGA